MVQFKMASLPVLVAKQELPAFPCLKSFDLCRFHILNFTFLLIRRNPLPVETARINQLKAGKCWLLLFGEQSENILSFTIVFRIQRNPSVRKRCEIINYRQEYAGTFCLASKTGSEAILNLTIAFSIPRNTHPEQTAINQYMAGKC